jgi:hypothetical protein
LEKEVEEKAKDMEEVRLKMTEVAELFEKKEIR